MGIKSCTKHMGGVRIIDGAGGINTVAFLGEDVHIWVIKYTKTI
jgi:hypothetical protein